MAHCTKNNEVADPRVRKEYKMCCAHLFARDGRDARIPMESHIIIGILCEYNIVVYTRSDLICRVTVFSMVCNNRVS